MATFITIPSKRLSESITSSASSFKLSDIKGWDGSDLVAGDFEDTVGYAVFRDSANTKMEIMEFDTSTIASTSITITRRGLKFNGDLTTEVTANKLSWVKGDTIVEIGTDSPKLFNNIMVLTGDQTAAGVKTFSDTPKSTAGSPVASEDLSTKAYVDLTATGSATYDKAVVAGTAGETVAAGDILYFDSVTDNEWKKADASASATSENVVLGIAQGAGTDGNLITNGVLISGVDTNQSGLTAGDLQYLSDTAGEMVNTADQTKVVTLGIAKSATSIYFYPRFNQNLTQSEIDYLTNIPVTTITTYQNIFGTSTTQFDISDQGGDTFRYTYDSTGTDPNIDSDTVPIGTVLVINAQNFDANNNGTFVITGVDSNYFEVTNVSGVVESNKTLGTGDIKYGYQKPSNLKYAEVIVIGAGGGGGGGNGESGGSSYSGDPGSAGASSVFKTITALGGYGGHGGGKTSGTRGKRNGYVSGNGGQGGGSASSDDAGGGEGSGGEIRMDIFQPGGLSTTETLTVGDGGAGGAAGSGGQSGQKGGIGSIIIREYF